MPFSKHPFKVHEGDRLNNLVESIAEQGVLVPLIVRTHPELKGAYEILADMLPSEIAKALKLEYDALKNQGKRSDLMAQLDEILSGKTTSNTDNSRVYLTSVPVEQKLDNVHES